MLNGLTSGRGEIFIGVVEDAERAVRFEPIADAEAKRLCLFDQLSDTIEPALRGDEVEIEVVPTEGAPAEVGLLRVGVRAGGFGPYAVLRPGGRDFVLRVGARLRPMTLEELRERFAVARGATALDEALAEVAAWRDELISKVRQTALHLYVKPAPALLIEPSVLERVTESRAEALGFLWALYAPGQPVSEDRGWKWESPLASSGLTILCRVSRDGSLEFRAPLDVLLQSPKGPREWLSPRYLSEYCVSALRFAALVWRGAVEDGATALVDVVLSGVRGLRLPASLGPSSWAQFDKRKSGAHVMSDTLYLEQPLRFFAEDILGTPDRCAYRIVLFIYSEFGLVEDAIPPGIFDRRSRLIRTT